MCSAISCFQLRPLIIIYLFQFIHNFFTKPASTHVYQFLQYSYRSHNSFTISFPHPLTSINFYHHPTIPTQKTHTFLCNLLPATSPYLLPSTLQLAPFFLIKLPIIHTSYFILKKNLKFLVVSTDINKGVIVTH